MRFRLCLSLLIPVVLGSGLGVSLAQRANESPVRVPAAPIVAMPSTPADSPSLRRIYRRAHMRTEPASSRPGHHPLAVDQGSLRRGRRRAAGKSTAAAFNAKRRDSPEATLESEPGVARSTAPETTPSSSSPARRSISTTPIEISDVHTVSLASFSATIAWRTSEPVSSRISYGLDSATLWTAADARSTAHVAVVGGLVNGTTYHFWVTAVVTDGRTATSPFLVTTPGLSRHPVAKIANSVFLLDGEPTFLTIAWGACSDSYASLLSDGIDTFMGKGCGSGSRELSSLGTRGYFIGDAFEAATPGAVGSFLPDEWDSSLPNSLTSADVQRMAPKEGGPRFLTLTNHFYSLAAPLPQGRGMYPALIGNADVIGFDLYPLQNWCRRDDFTAVFDSQRELVDLAGGKPTFQWIEVAHMDCKDPALNPTPETVRAETWLAVAGGAHALGYFPKDFAPEIGAEISHEKRELQTLAPALVEPAIDASASSADVRVGARNHNGAIYVIAVNARRRSASSTISVPALRNRALVSLDGTRSLTVANGRFTDTFAPLDVHIYIAAP
jgi:hypothetical protein